MKKGKTSSGFSFSVNENIIKDYRFVKLLAEADALEPEQELRAVIICSELINMLLGKDGEERLTKHVEKKGVASFDDVYTEVGEILKLLREEDKEVKN